MITTPFDSFWMAGYECSDQLNCFGNRVDLLTTSGHLHLIDDDYQSLSMFNIKTVREGIRWSSVEKSPYQYDWSTVLIMFEKAKEYGIQQIWDICHFGYADDLTPLHPMFARRFSALCSAFATMYKQHFPYRPLIVTPINEVSFISWLGGDVKGTSPYCHAQGWQVKYALMKAYIEGAHALKKIDPFTKILSTEPLISIVAPPGSSVEDQERALLLTAEQYQATDMLSGRMCPELGGSPDLLDIVGINYYYNNQWSVIDHSYLCWKTATVQDGWTPLSDLLQITADRYKVPIVLSETSHAGEDRPDWISYVGKECDKAIQQSVPLLGICLYPIIDRTDWDYPDLWHHSGLWDNDGLNESVFGRTLCQPYASVLLHAQHKIAATLSNIPPDLPVETSDLVLRA